MRKGFIINQDFLNTFDKESEAFDIVSLKKLIEQSFGETNNLDFKEKLIKEDIVAKLILAMANSKGGAIVFGVSDKGNALGLNEEEIKDNTDFEKNINKYLPSNLHYNLQIISYNEDELYGEFSGKKFYVIYIPKQDRYIPFLAIKNSEKLNSEKIYVRKNASIETASNEDLEEIFERRLIEQHDDLSNLNLDEHIDQLKILYGSISKYHSEPFTTAFTRSIRAPFVTKTENKYYPKEEFDEFISRMIKKKKKRIEIVLDLIKID